MRKLGKKGYAVENSIEAFICDCACGGCNCACSCVCNPVALKQTQTQAGMHRIYSGNTAAVSAAVSDKSLHNDRGW